MTARSYVCEDCGAPANVHVMHEIGRPGSAHHYCMRCTDIRSENSVRRNRLNRDALTAVSLLLVLGMALLLLSPAAEWMGLPGELNGFEFQHTAGLAVSLTIAAALLFGWYPRRSLQSTLLCSSSECLEEPARDST